MLDWMPSVGSWSISNLCSKFTDYRLNSENAKARISLALRQTSALVA